MDWIKEMKEAMLKLQKACEKNTTWADCYKCPFDEYCTILDKAGSDTPDIWTFEEDK